MQTSRKMQIRMMSGVLLGSGGGLMVEGCDGLAIVGHPPQLGNGGTLTLRAFKGEGERKPEACTCASAQVHASGLVLGGGGWIHA